MKTKKAISLLLPLILVLFFFNIVTTYKTWLPRTTGLRINNDAAQQITNDIVDTIIKSDKAGEINLEIHVPLFNYGDNYPIATYGSGLFVDTLYRYGVIQNKINLTFIPDSELNKKYNLYLP